MGEVRRCVEETDRSSLGYKKARNGDANGREGQNETTEISKSANSKNGMFSRSTHLKETTGSKRRPAPDKKIHRSGDAAPGVKVSQN
uniref:Ovule protein n=1 Tax=Steinernema glaseri TaxID=37863 RepID=A0A1I7ZGE1_9BILA